MKYLGHHVSIAGGVENAPLNASLEGAKAFGMFTKNQRQWSAKPLSETNIRLFKTKCRELDFAPDFILPHDSYLINLATNDPEMLLKSRNAFYDEFSRCSELGLKMLNFHPGCHLNRIDTSQALLLTAEAVNLALAQTSGITAVIENTAGQGSCIASKFEEIAEIIRYVEDKSRVGVCIDTCHAFAAGYDLKEHYDEVWSDFEKKIGFKYLKALHLNDSLKTLSSRLDRHASIGKGELGIEFFKKIVKDKRFDDMPLIMETPDESLWKEENELLYSFV